MKEGFVVFDYFKAYAKFLLDNCLDDLTRQDIKRSRELEIPVLKFLDQLSEEQLFEISKKGIREYLSSIVDGTAIDKIVQSNVDWKEDKLEGVTKLQLGASDIALIFNIRKNSLRNYLPRYTKDLDLVIKILDEIDNYFTFQEELAVSSLTEISKEAITAQKNQLQNAIDLARLGYWEYDRETKSIKWSPELYSFYGLDKENGIVDEIIEKQIHPDDIPNLRGNVKILIEKGGSFTQEYRITNTNGETRYLLDKAYSETLSNGKRLIKGISQDITESKVLLINQERSNKLIEEKQSELLKAQETLLKANTLLETKVEQRTKELTLINELNKIIAGELEIKKIIQSVTDITTKITKAEFGAFFYNLVNKEGEKYTVYTLSGVPIENFTKFPLPRNTMVFEPTFHGSGIVRSDDITKDARYGHNAPYKGLPEGHLPVKSYLAVPVTSRTGEVLGGLFYGHKDAGVFTQESENYVTSITGHVGIAIDNANLFNALTDSEQKFRAMADNIPNLAWMADPEGSIFWYNKAWYDYTGTTPESMLGWGWQDVHHPEHLPTVIKEWTSSIKTGTPFEMVFPLKSESGEFLPFLTRVNPVRDEKGKILRWFGTNTEIGKEIKTNNELRNKNLELERINKDLDNFVYTASHDLKAPISNIEGLIYGIHDVVNNEELNREDILLMVSYIEESIKKFKTTISDLTEISKLQKGINEIETIDLNLVIDDVKFSISELIKTTGTTLLIDLKVDSIQFVLPHIKSIFYNLISNSIKYKHPQRAPVVTIRTYKEESFVVIVFSDNGIGIANNHLNNLFEMFKRFHNHVDGSGVGLYIVKRIIDNTGGKIEVTSEVDKGTTFKVFIRDRS